MWNGYNVVLSEENKNVLVIIINTVEKGEVRKRTGKN